MPPVIRISDTTFKKLQKLAIPLEDSHDSVIGRLADTALSGQIYALPEVYSSGIINETPTTIETGYVAKHDDLTHTRLVSATFDGDLIVKPNWNALVKHAHIQAHNRLNSFEQVRKTTHARVKEGKYESEGFYFIPEVNFSLQGMDSNMSWDNSVRLARLIGVQVSATFEWHNKSKAARPGEMDTLTYTP